MSLLRLTYLVCALLGAVLPVRHYLAFLMAHDWSVAALGAAWLDTIGTGLNWDMGLAALVLSLWILAETRVRRNWSALWAIAATFVIGVGCGLPLYLFLRTRKVA